MGTQFSMVTHWNTVSMASPMLSNEVIPAHAHKLDMRWGLVTASLTCVGPRPLFQTHGHVRITEVGSPRRVRGVAEKTRGALHPLHHDFIWNKSELKLFSLMSTFIKCSFNKWMWLGPSVEHFPLQFVCFCMYCECDALAVYYSKIN